MNLMEWRVLLDKLINDSDFAHKSYFAGGCVRDFLLNPDSSITSDIDICVEIFEGGIALAKYLQNYLPESDIIIHQSFGTASLRYKNYKLEFVATRKEKYYPGSRYPQVQFGNLLDDVLRRDFTINALLMSITTGEILDLSCKGLSDLKQGIIRTVQDPDKSFSEDPLRMLRALQFALRFNFQIEDKTLKAMQKNTPALKILSKRAIQEELNKIPESKRQEAIAFIDKMNWKPYLKHKSETQNEQC